MIKKLVSHGNSAALIIDKPILDILKVDMDTEYIEKWVARLGLEEIYRKANK